VVGEWDMSAVTPADVRAAAATLTGAIEQVPPMVSAVKIGGRLLHELARQGIEVERPPRKVSVYRFDVAPDPERPGVYRAEVECSSGTYIRVLADDIGTALGGGAHIGLLRRTRIGSFGGGEMRPLDHLTHDAILTPAQAMRDLPLIAVEPEIGGLIGRGLALDRVPIGAVGEGPWAMVDQQGRLLAVYEATGTDRIKPAVVLAGS
jgi:tRNA pseudouridine55 synthase